MPELIVEAADLAAGAAGAGPGVMITGEDEWTGCVAIFELIETGAGAVAVASEAPEDGLASSVSRHMNSSLSPSLGHPRRAAGSQSWVWKYSTGVGGCKPAACTQETTGASVPGASHRGARERVAPHCGAFPKSPPPSPAIRAEISSGPGVCATSYRGHTPRRAPRSRADQSPPADCVRR